MSYQPSSAQGYASLGTMPARQSSIYKFLKSAGRGSAGYSNRQIAEILKWPINVVTPRVLELRELGYVELAGRRADHRSGISVMHWKVSDK